MFVEQVPIYICPLYRFFLFIYLFYLYFISHYMYFFSALSCAIELVSICANKNIILNLYNAILFSLHTDYVFFYIMP